ncbi:MAG: pentapeptide repeat-containing protein [Crocinitomicaceae bacterium]|nr:pentapeptide repeat-containing protein [Crocinitomicaceae bacterium]MBK8926437.1 pentapeptide repeat-containing protein [Crocinitomicaceae bacterium]
MINSKLIGNKIAQARKKINLSQAELANKISISPQAVGKWERGESMPDIITLNRLSELFQVDLNYFSENSNHEINDKPIEKYTETIHKEPVEKKIIDGGWDMSEGNWTDANFSGIKNLSENFCSSNLKKCDFLNSDLSKLNLTKNNMEACDFSGTKFNKSIIKSSNFLDNKYIQCDFTEVEIVKTNLEKCNFTQGNFTGSHLSDCNIESCNFSEVVWKSTQFIKTNFSHLIFSGALSDCHFERCGFYRVIFENATIKNSFFKYNERFSKVQFVNCKTDSITYAFLKNNAPIPLNTETTKFCTFESRH